jgi:hypothetical protein
MRYKNSVSNEDKLFGYLAGGVLALTILILAGLLFL